MRFNNNFPSLSPRTSQWILCVHRIQTHFFFFFSNKRTSLRQSSSLFVINFQLFPSISLLTINPPFLRRPHIIPRFFLLDKTTCLETINVHTVHTIVVIRNFTQKLVLHRYLSRSFFQQNGQREWERSKKERKKRKRDGRRNIGWCNPKRATRVRTRGWVARETKGPLRSRRVHGQLNGE